MYRVAFLALVLTLFVVLAAPSAAQTCSCTYNYGATYCCALYSYTPQTVQCSLNGYQWSCQDRLVSNPYVTTKIWSGSGSYCSADFIDAWVGSTSCHYEKASCSTQTPGVCVWTESHLYCHIYNRPAGSSCGGGGPL